MSTVNRQVYPDRTTALSGIQLTSTQFADIALNTEWETSIAISQSTADYAPYNRITYITLKNDVTPSTYDPKEITNSVQKIAIYYTQNLINMAQTQYYNGSISYSGSSFNISQLNDAPYNFYSMRRTPAVGSWTEGLINTLQQQYNKRGSFIITGMDFKKILCVICVGFTSGNYCSLKYYLDNKQSMSLTPSNLFMIGLIDNDGGANLQTFCPINMSTIKYHFWQRNEQTGIISDDERELQTLFPMPVLRQLTALGSGRNVGATQVGTMAFPLIACMGDGRMNLTNYWVSKPAAGTPIFGGQNNYHYTLHEDSNMVYTHLSQYAFDDVMKVAACYGLPFSIEFPQDRNNFYTDTSINTYIPIANDGGYFTGNYEPLTVAGVLNPNLSLPNLQIYNGGKNAPYNDRNYDPDIPISTDIIDLIQPTLTPIDCFNKTYILNRTDVETLADTLWTQNQSAIDQMTELFSNWHAGNALNGIINLMLFPFDVRLKTGPTTIEHIVIGKYVSSIETYRIGETPSARYSLGSFKWNNEFGNTFLDYSPYTEAELYIPYFGTIPISPEHFLNKEISIDLVVDFVNGAATVIVFVQENNAKHPVIYKNGNIAVQIPLASNRSMEQQKQVLQNALSFGGGLKTRLENMIGGGKAEPSGMEQMPNLLDGNGQLRLPGPVQPQGEINSAVSSAILGAAAIAASPQAKIAMMAGQAILNSLPTFNSPSVFNEAGSATPDCALYLPNKPYIILYRPKVENLENYAHLIGHATMEDCVIGNCHGFSKFSNVDLSGLTATEEEKRLILTFLESGVYL